eukprot:365053-Chlamydomonas_euryale.AAC.29
MSCSCRSAPSALSPPRRGSKPFAYRACGRRSVITATGTPTARGVAPCSRSRRGGARAAAVALGGPYSSLGCSRTPGIQVESAKPQDPSEVGAVRGQPPLSGGSAARPRAACGRRSESDGRVGVRHGRDARGGSPGAGWALSPLPTAAWTRRSHWTHKGLQ